MKLIVALGNPGKEYAHTRHNTGFEMLDAFLEKYQLALHKKKFQGLYVEWTYHGEKLILLKPQSYMNLSGEVVRKYVEFFGIPLENILVICDDIALEVGNYRLRAQGSSAGHNGLKNIEENLHTQAYKRLRIGVSHPDQVDLKDYVLGKFTKEEEAALSEIKPVIVEIIEKFLTADFTWLMTKYNHKNG